MESRCSPIVLHRHLLFAEGWGIVLTILIPERKGVAHGLDGRGWHGLFAMGEGGGVFVVTLLNH